MGQMRSIAERWESDNLMYMHTRLCVEKLARIERIHRMNHLDIKRILF